MRLRGSNEIDAKMLRDSGGFCYFNKTFGNFARGEVKTLTPTFLGDYEKNTCNLENTITQHIQVAGQTIIVQE